MRKMDGNRSVLISFGELAWLFLMGVLLVYCSHIRMLNGKLTQANSIVQNDDLLKERQLWEGRYNAESNKNAILKKDIEDKAATISSLNDQLKRKNEQYDVLLAQTIAAGEKVRQLEKDLKASDTKDTGIRKELLGLQGSLRRVVFIMDKSGSMDDDGRWEMTCKIVESWLLYLNVEECVFITFSDTLETIPNELNGHTYLAMRGDERKSNLTLLSQQLRKLRTGGYTDTYSAIKKGAEYAPDMIILFTDGAPRKGSDFFKKFSNKEMDKILKLSAEQKIPINVIALGDYFDENLCTFLRKLAKRTEGSFRGM